ncbi:MAG TPA: hypothetical protein VHH34_15660, partial [Pseudonocardiaceae bacterium]|nr:hypothetical protein [Pseudonocardiaceae bacterium]
GDYFQDIGEFAVVGVDPDYLSRTWRLVGLLVDRDFGLAAWQPGWLLVVPALAALLGTSRRGTGPPGITGLVLPLLAGWLVATFLALTMHGWWWPGRQTVVVLPLALLVVLCWLARTSPAVRAAGGALGLAGVGTYAALLLDGHAGKIVWVNGYTQVHSPTYQALRPLLPAYGNEIGHLGWVVVLGLVAVAAGSAARPRAAAAEALR